MAQKKQKGIARRNPEAIWKFH